MYIRSTVFLASVFIQAGQLTEAETTLDEIISEWQPRQSMFIRMGWKVKADLALAQGKPDLALEIVDRLLDTAENIQEYGRRSIPALSAVRGDALAMLGRWEEAEVEFQAAVELAARQNRIPLMRSILVRQGWLYSKERKNDLAGRSFDRARAITEQIARQVPDHQREQFLRSALSEIPPIHRPTSNKEKTARPGGLSRREQEVATLIAQGKSNREIAEALYLSVRTVEAHITRILTRLGFSSRTEVAVWAAGQQLAPASGEDSYT
jgi:DNA-binding NarL/FixJ family response regulator